MGGSPRETTFAPVTDAPECLWSTYYEELQSIAVSVMRGEPRSPSLEPTLVLHEAYVRIFRGGTPEWRGKAYFVATIARAMRHYLIDRARRRRVERVGISVIAIRDIEHLSLSNAGNLPEASEALNVAIEDLAKVAPRAATVVEMRCAYGLSSKELATILGISERTAKADWTFARAWLFSRLNCFAEHG